eukprot:1541347-Pleurochrysis_carterae.AAC.2
MNARQRVQRSRSPSLLATQRKGGRRLHEGAARLRDDCESEGRSATRDCTLDLATRRTVSARDAKIRPLKTRGTRSTRGTRCA